MLPAPDFNHQRPGLMPRPFRRILVGWDGSADSVAAFRMAVAIMGDAPGAVTAFAVLPDLPRPEAYRDEPAVPASTRRVLTSFESVRAAVAAATPAKISLHTTASKHVARAICDYAVQEGSDLLVMGRHGYGGEWHPKLGHVAEAAAKASKIPVLLVTAR